MSSGRRSGMALGTLRRARGIVSQLDQEIQREDEQNRGRDHPGGVCSLAQRPERVDDAIDRFDDDPQPHERGGGWPAAAHGPEEAPHPERHERDVEDDERELAIRRDQAGEESGGWKGLPEPAEVFLERVRGLSGDERGEGGVEASHVAEWARSRTLGKMLMSAKELASSR